MIMKELMKKSILTSGISLVFGMVGAWIFTHAQKGSNNAGLSIAAPNVYRNASMALLPEGFVKASAISTPTVVYIKNESTVEYRNPFFWDFDPFGSRGKATSTGSGVIIRSDGYIVTNNHVINGADKITVVLSHNKREYTAKVIGADGNSDLAVLKIDATNLPAIAFGNSDELLVGDWVLAVGNPFNLTSTVTAGIVSAKGRNINIMHNQFPIESFIQTDAAINPGNSGGALINTKGELVGINTAIQSNTGSYTGYGFAIPANVVAKIVKDFVDYGEVKRAFAGMDLSDISAAKSNELKYEAEGALVSGLLEEGPAAKAGLQENDIITALDGHPVSSKSSLDEQLAYRRPGDAVKLSIWRAGAQKEITVDLISGTENKALLQKGAVNSKVLGADFQPLTATELNRYRITEGVKIINVVPGSYADRLNLEDGYIVTKFNGKVYKQPEDLIAAMESTNGRIHIEGINKNGTRSNFSYFSY